MRGPSSGLAEVASGCSSTGCFAASRTSFRRGRARSASRWRCLQASGSFSRSHRPVRRAVPAQFTAGLDRAHRGGRHPRRPQPRSRPPRGIARAGVAMSPGRRVARLLPDIRLAHRNPGDHARPSADSRAATHESAEGQTCSRRSSSLTLISALHVGRRRGRDGQSTATITNWASPRGVRTSTVSPAVLPTRALPTGDMFEIRPADGSASGGPTSS